MKRFLSFFCLCLVLFALLVLKYQTTDNSVDQNDVRHFVNYEMVLFSKEENNLEEA